MESAARTFCKGYHFAEAMRVLGLNGRSDLLEPVIDQGLVDGLATSAELLADCKDQINAQVPRLRLLRTKKEEDPLAFYDGPSTDASIPDNISLAGSTASTTGASLFTRYTGATGMTGTLNTQTSRKTSKNRRREERKRARGKKGSVYEEEYLVNSIGRLIERVESVREDVARLVEGCVRRGMRERAMALQRSMSEVVGLCKECAEEVFTGGSSALEGTGADGSGAPVEGEDDEEGRGRPGAAGVLQESLEQRGRKREIPVIKDFERLSLLGA